MILARGLLLSPHFTVDEALVSTPDLSLVPVGVAPNVQFAAGVLESARQILDSPLTPTSWYRDTANNERVGGVLDSSHLSGYGVDFTAKGLTPHEIVSKLHPHVRALGLDELIEYPAHVHLSADPRRRAKVLVANGDGTYSPWRSQASIPMSSHDNGTTLKGRALVVALIGAIVAAVLEVLKRTGN